MPSESDVKYSLYSSHRIRLRSLFRLHEIPISFPTIFIICRKIGCDASLVRGVGRRSVNVRLGERLQFSISTVVFCLTIGFASLRIQLLHISLSLSPLFGIYLHLFLRAFFPCSWEPGKTLTFLFLFRIMMKQYILTTTKRPQAK